MPIPISPIALASKTPILINLLLRQYITKDAFKGSVSLEYEAKNSSVLSTAGNTVEKEREAWKRYLMTLKSSIPT
jgi:hypothetical protein